MADWPRAPNPIRKDMYPQKSSKLEVRDVWPTGLFKSEVLIDSGNSNNSEGIYLIRKRTREQWDPTLWEVLLQPLPKRQKAH